MEFECVSGAYKCPPRKWACPSNGQCIPDTYLCNGQPDCPDGADEKNCSMYFELFILSLEAYDDQSHC